ncbi:MAG: penicillin-binding protein 2, partial [Desulfonatronovibrionaceae bacterium]
MSLFKGSSFSHEKFGPYLLLFLIISLFGVFSLRLWYLQIYKADYFALKARENVQRRQQIYAPRGLFLDRYGQLLAVNEPSYSLALVREDCPDIPAALEQISQWTGKELSLIRKEFERGEKMV